MSLMLGPSHDAQRFRAHNRFAYAVLAVGLLLLVARLLLVQWVRGERYEKYAAIEQVTKVRAQAPRGLVRAAGGDVLARNIESHRLEIQTHRLKQERIPELARTLREVLDMTDAEFDGLRTELGKPVDPRKRRPLVVRRDLVSTHCPYDSSKLELVMEAPYGFCTTCGRYFEPVPKKRACPFDQKRLVATGEHGLHCPTCEREFLDGHRCPYDNHAIRHGKHILQCPLCLRTFNDEVAVLRANQHRLAEARVVAEIQREYPFRYLASHLLGYMGYVDGRDLEPMLPWLPPGLGLNDRVGRSGIEKAFEIVLRGVDGEQILVKRSGREEPAQGLDELTAALQPRPTTPGYTLRLTLDMDLQRAAKIAMKDVYSGAAVVLDTRTGAVLVLYSKPGFDPNTMSGKRTRETRAAADITAYAPLMNKAVHPFPPASVYKVVAAAAGLEERVVNPNTVIHCPGHYEFGGRRFHCHERRGHGDMRLHQALRSSCDVYFYILGEQLGLDRLERYARQMGFGEATGIEIREALGRIPTRDWYRDHVPGGYYPGFALSTAVGQKDVTSTPLQVARVFSALGHDGNLAPVHLIAGFETAGAGTPEVAQTASPGKLIVPLRPEGRPLGLKDSTLQLLRAALLAVVEEEGGTARGSQPERVTMAGKTGTAQAPQRARPEILERLHGDPGATARLQAWLLTDHAWFVGYAPADAPEITVAVFIEHGGSGGHNAAPIVRQIVDAWFARKPMPPLAEPQAKRRRPAAVPQPSPLDDPPLHDPPPTPSPPAAGPDEHREADPQAAPSVSDEVDTDPPPATPPAGAAP